MTMPRVGGFEVEGGAPFCGSQQPCINFLGGHGLLVGMGVGSHGKASSMGFFGQCFLELTPLGKPVTRSRFLTCMRPAVLHKKEQFAICELIRCGGRL